jgi:hypothetical protein
LYVFCFFFFIIILDERVAERGVERKMERTVLRRSETIAQAWNREVRVDNCCQPKEDM